MFDDQLAGSGILYFSGHMGPDPGAQCTDLAHTFVWRWVCYDVSLRLARDLIHEPPCTWLYRMIMMVSGMTLLDCDTDENCNGRDLPLRQLDRPEQRADHINRLYRKYKKQGHKNKQRWWSMWIPETKSRDRMYSFITMEQIRMPKTWLTICRQLLRTNTTSFRRVGVIRACW